MAGDTPHDVFISYSSKDKLTADAICAMLERDGLRCWIAPRDVDGGEEWAQSIIQAISGSHVFVLVFSGFANASQQVRREVERAANREVPIIPFRIEDVPAHQSLEFFISSPHWMDALTPPLEAHIRRLSEAVQRLLSRHGMQRWAPSAQPATSPPAAAPASLDSASAVPGAADATRPSAGTENKPSAPHIASMRKLLLTAGALVVVAAIAVFLFMPLGRAPGSTDVASATGNGRLELALVANDPAKGAGPPLHQYGDAARTYRIERDITLPGDVEQVATATDANGRPALDIILAQSARDRINGDPSIVGRDIALVLDGRTVLSVATVEAPLGTYVQLTGEFTLASIRRLIGAISAGAPTTAPAKQA